MWLIETYRADVDVKVIRGRFSTTPIVVLPVLIGTEGCEAACRCYRCGHLLTAETLTVDRIIPGCRGGTYRRDNIRPACATCNSSTGAQTRSGKASRAVREVKDDDPPGWHVREKTDTGYPVMGSSPAERADAEERKARSRAEAMRDHPFEGDGQYCAAMIGGKGSGDPATTGVVTMSVGCGYRREHHPAPVVPCVNPSHIHSEVAPESECRTPDPYGEGSREALKAVLAQMEQRASDYEEASREDWARRCVRGAGKDWATHFAKYDGTVIRRGIGSEWEDI